MLKLSSLDSNWETIAFYLIEPLINDKKRRFSRQQILKDIDNVTPLLPVIGHKKNPQHTEESFQRALENMRDKKWLNFLGGGYTGEYELTDTGYISKKILTISEKTSRVLEIYQQKTAKINIYLGRKVIIHKFIITSGRKRGRGNSWYSTPDKYF